ncbi:MAG: hypothetical protein ACM3VT_08190 [Solirubrobacterales bacterium]
MVNRNLAFAYASFVFLAAAGCQQNEHPRIASIEPADAVKPAAVMPKFTALTLSAEQLMSLDWSGREVGRSVVVDKRIVGSGVEFDIRFPRGVAAMDYISSMGAGQGALTGRDVSAYQTLALKFTLVSINGSSDPNVPLELAAGALIGPAGDGRLSACELVTLGLSPDHATKISSTLMRTRIVRVIGIHMRLIKPLAWDPQGSVVTLRVEPAADAEVLPTPAPVVDPKSATRATRSTAARSSSSAAKAATAKTSKAADKPRTKSTPSPTKGTTHIGAW